MTGHLRANDWTVHPVCSGSLSLLGTHDTAIASIADYIERFYNPQRRHSHLDYISPIEFELKAQVAALAA